MVHYRVSELYPSFCILKEHNVSEIGTASIFRLGSEETYIQFSVLGRGNVNP
jgi:hypothetical protein